MPCLPVWDINSSTAVVATRCEEVGGKIKDLVRRGCSGLIESFGSMLHWSETCYRNPVSWFPNNKIREWGFVVLWDKSLPNLCDVWGSLPWSPGLVFFWCNQIKTAIWKHCMFYSHVEKSCAIGIKVWRKWLLSFVFTALKHECFYSVATAVTPVVNTERHTVKDLEI